MTTPDRQEGLRKRKSEGWSSNITPQLPWHDENLNREEAIEIESSQGPTTIETLMAIPLSPQQERPNNSMTGKQVAKEESKLQKVVVRVTSGALMVSAYLFVYSHRCCPVSYRKLTCNTSNRLASF